MFGEPKQGVAKTITTAKYTATISFKFVTNVQPMLNDDRIYRGKL